MAQDKPKVRLIEQHLATRRRIKEIERKRLAKLGGQALTGPTCSFCGWTAEGVRIVIEGPNDARICSECIEKITGMLRGDEDK
jgi:hypothetical protein